MGIKNLMGLRFGRAEVIEQAGIYPHSKSGGRMWLCRCDCGKTFNVVGSSLTCGRTKSCGCLRSELRALRNRALRKPLETRRHQPTERTRAVIENMDAIKVALFDEVPANSPIVPRLTFQ